MVGSFNHIPDDVFNIEVQKKRMSYSFDINFQTLTIEFLMTLQARFIKNLEDLEMVFKNKINEQANKVPNLIYLISKLLNETSDFSISQDDLVEFLLTGNHLFLTSNYNKN